MIEKLGVYVVLLSGGLVYANEYFGIPWLASLAIMLFGLWVAAWGVEVALKGEVKLINREYRRYEFFSGVPAGLWAAIFITTGGLLLFFGYLDWTSPGGTESFLDRLTNSPAGWGVVLGVAGLLVTAVGVIRLLAGSAMRDKRVSKFQELGFRLGGAWYTLFGLAMLSLAAGLFFAPSLLKSIFDGLVNLVKEWILSR